MSVDQSLDQPSLRRISGESRDDRILEALARFRHDVMKEIFLIKEALKESLIGSPESLCPSESVETSLSNQNDTDSPMNYEVIRRTEKHHLHKQSRRSRIDDHDFLKREFVECFPGHPIRSPAIIDCHGDGAKSSLDTSLNSNVDLNKNRNLFGAVAEGALISSLELSEERTGIPLNSGCDMVSIRSPLRKLMNKTSTANSFVERERFDSYIVSSKEKEQEDCRDSVKEELCSDFASSHDPFPFQIQSALPSSSGQSHILRGNSLHRTGTNTSSSSNSLDVNPRLANPLYPSNIHGWIKTFTCKICRRHFGNSSNLKVHMRVHTREKPYECEHCGKRFTTTSNLKVHIRTHTGERPYKCTHCHKAFINHSNLKTHSQIHIAQREYERRISGENYAYHSQLKAQLNDSNV